MRADPPQDGDGFSWFDELKFIEWGEWQTGEADLAVPNPNNYRFIQIRGSNTALADATVFYYEETTYAHVLTAAPDETVSSADGHLVDTLFRGVLQGGERRSFTWDGRDEQSQRRLLQPRASGGSG